MIAMSWQPLLQAGVMLLLSGVAVQLLSIPPEKAESLRFSDWTSSAGLHLKTFCGTQEKRFIVEGNGSGCGWFDFDRDGWQDLYIVNGIDLENFLAARESAERHPNFLFRNNGDGTFTDVTAAAGVSGTGLGNGVALADFDGDGWMDIFVTNYGRDLLYRNRGDGTFEEVGRQAGVAGGDLWSTGAVFGDFDLDGWLDLYVARYLSLDRQNMPLDGEFCRFRGLDVMCGPLGLPPTPDSLYRNLGDGTFEDVSSTSGILDVKARHGFSALFEDFDDDGYPDLFVANDSGPNFLFHNLQDGTFHEVGLASGVAFNAEGRPQADMGIAAGDVGYDGRTDLFVTTFADDYFPFFQNKGDLFFEENSRQAGLAAATVAALGWGTFLFDYDADGVLDLFAAAGHLYPEMEGVLGTSYHQADLLFRGNPHHPFRFIDARSETGWSELPVRSSRGAAYCDFDNDGDLDWLILAIDDSPTLVRNNTTGQNWLLVQAETREGAPAIGALVEVEVGGRRRYGRVRSGGSFLSQNDLRVHFGFGRQTGPLTVRIHWAAGNSTTIGDVQVNQILRVRAPAS